MKLETSEEEKGTVMKEEAGWVIERGDSPSNSPTYWAGVREDSFMLVWSQDHLDAVRFSRKEDAERVMYGFRQPNCRASEHIWLSKEAKEGQRTTPPAPGAAP